MRLGRLDKRAQILELAPDMSVSCLATRWVGIRAKDAGDFPAPPGLRVRAMIEVRARYSDLLVQGRYLKCGSRLFRITSARDVMATKSDLVMSCDEFVGEPGEYRPDGFPPSPCRVHLTYEAPYFDDIGQVTCYKTRGEIALIEAGRIQTGEILSVSGIDYQVINYAADTDDGVVRGLWLDPL